MFSFSSQFLKTDVTAVKIHNNLLLVGIGGFLHIFDNTTLKEIKKLSIFEGQKIYGIVINKASNKIFLYGGKCMKIFRANRAIEQFCEKSDATSLDWILDGKWIDEDKELATVSMHNKVQIWNDNLELVTEIECEEKCILYSAYICYEKIYELTVLSGTVFSEVLIWKPINWEKNNCMVLKRLQKHNGVIFSVHYNEKSGYICSSSDDRSAILWKIKHKDLYSELDQETIEINPACQVYGHLSRIFCCQVLKNCFVTAGEDSFLNVWSFDGKLIRKVETHQGGPVWTLGSDGENNFVVTGGGDCGVIRIPINSKVEEQRLTIAIDEIPKLVRILASSNLIALSEKGILYYYIRTKSKWLEIQLLEGLKSYALLVPSDCKKLVALAGFHGQIYIYQEVNHELKQICFFQTKAKSRIFSFHWLNCTTFLICQTEGKITLLYIRRNKIFPVAKFILPPSKERWTTTAAYVKNNVVVGDRKGNIHLFQFGKVEAVQTVKKAHSHLGVTNLIVQNEEIKSLGRNGVIKTFSLNKDELHLLSSDKLPFSWLSNIIDSLLLAFSSNKFIIWSIDGKRIIYERWCGGGHRSWDFLKNVRISTFCYIKDKVINVVDFKINDFLPLDVQKGYHIKEVNSVGIIKVVDNKYILISGGEDTTIRISLCEANYSKNLLSLKSHLSSIRTITKFKINNETNNNQDSYLLFSAGGRAQIVCWKLYIFTKNETVTKIECSEQHSYYKPLDCEESEMRIMDLCLAEIANKLVLFCACSNGNIKMFSVDKNAEGNYCLTFHRDIFYKLKCIMKLCYICIHSHDVLVTMATDGKLVFWDLTGISRDKGSIKPFDSIQIHQSGINSVALKFISDNLCLFVTGGDDNAIVLNLIEFNVTNSSIKIDLVDSFMDTGTHCAQITGVFIFDDHFITASIDQRVAVFRYHWQNAKITCKYITKYNTSVADVQGVSCFESYDLDTFVYGKGIEYIKIKKTLGARFYI